MDSESLDRCIQTALSALYPPFQATSPTVLCQVLSVVERCYRGDGLRYLLHFLLPAKQFLQNLQQDACLPYCGLLFRHEGWPLCLHEKVVIQLCHLDQHLLHPGDFYLLVSPSAAPSSSRHSASRHSTSRHGPPTPRLLLCSVSSGSRHVEEQEIPELALSSLFTMAWLDSVNRDREQRGASRMERILLSAHGDVFRVPWEDLVYPQFISRPRASLKDDKEASVKDGLINTSSRQEGTILCSNEHSLGQDTKPLPCPVNQSMPSSDESDSEGEYVELAELPLPRFSPQKGSLTQLISQQHKARTSTQILDKTTTPAPQTVPTQFQSTQNHLPAASKASSSSCTELSHSGSKPVEEKDNTLVVNGPVILTPITQPSITLSACAGTFHSPEQSEGTNLSKSLDLRPTNDTQRDEEKETVVFENMDSIAVLEDGLENVEYVLIEKREDGLIISKGESVEEEEEVELVGINTGEEAEVELEAEVKEVIGPQENQCEREDQKSEHTHLNMDLNEGQMQCIDSELPDTQEACIVQTQQMLSDVHSELINPQDTHLEETSPENSEIIYTESAYLETGEAQNMVSEEFELVDLQNVYSQETRETSEIVELSLDAYIDDVRKQHDQLEMHSELLQTCIIYLEATDSENFELFDSQDAYAVNTKEDFEKEELQNKMQDRLIDEVGQSRPSTHCEMEKQKQDEPFVELDMQCFGAELATHNTQNIQVEGPETKCRFAKDEDIQVELEKANPELLKRHSKEMKETPLDLDKGHCTQQTHGEEIESQHLLDNMEIDKEIKPESETQDALSDKCPQAELCNTHVDHCEEPETPLLLTSMEIVHDTSSVRDIQNTGAKLDEQTETQYTPDVSKPQNKMTEKQICNVQEGQPMFPEKIQDRQTERQLVSSEMSNKQDFNELEIQRILFEMVDTVVEETDLLKIEEFDKTHESKLSAKVTEQEMDILETASEHSQSKTDKMDHTQFEERQNPIEEMPNTTATSDTCCEIDEPQDDKMVAAVHFEENVMQLECLSSKPSTQNDKVEAQYETESLQEKVETELRQTEESKMQDSHCNEPTQNKTLELELEKQQIQTSQETTETIEDTNISNQPEAHKTLSNTEMTKPVDTKTPCLDSQISNIQSQSTEIAATEHLLSDVEIIQHKNEDKKQANFQSHKTQETEIKKLEETVTPAMCVSENGPQHEELKEADKLDTQHPSQTQNGQPEMPKVQKTNFQETANGPKVKTGETKEVFELKNGTKLDKVQTEGSRTVHPGVNLSNGSIPKAPEKPPLALHVNHSVPLQLAKSPQSRFSRVLLSSGVLCLPGTRDKSGRALLTICTRNPVWFSPDCDSAELLQVLLYYSSTLRKEVRALGLTVLVDVRRAPPVQALFSALRSLQEGTPGSIHIVLLLINKDSPVRLDKPPSLQVEMLHSMKSLQKHMDLRQLPVEFGGSFNFSQSSWLCYRARVENLTNQCNNVINLLHKTINILESTPLPSDAENAEQLLSKYRAVMCSILQDSRLVQLQQEGGASLSRLRRDESTICATEDYRAAVEAVSSLYDQVDELLHRLVTLSNSRTQELHFIVEFTGLETGFNEVRIWLQEVGEVRLRSLEEPEDSLELLIKNQKDFKDFCTTAYDWCKRGQGLLKRLEHWDNISSADLRVYEVKVHAFWTQLQDFSQRVNTTGKNIDQAVRLYSFLDQAYGWALEGMRHLAEVTMEDCSLPDKCQAVIGCLEDYKRNHPPIPDAHFQEMRALAEELRGERGLRQWSFAWAKCQETKKMFDRKMGAALRTRESAQRRRSDSVQSKSSSGFSRKALSGLWSAKEAPQMSPNQTEEDSGSCSPTTPSPPRNSTASPVTSTPQHTPLLHRLFRTPSTDDAKDPTDIYPSPAPSLQRLDSSSSFASSFTSSFTSNFTSPSICSSSYTPLSRRQQLRKTQSFDCPPTPESSRYGASPRTLSEPARRGNTGVFIRGLEVTSTEAADRTLCPRTGSQGWAVQGTRSPSTLSINRDCAVVDQRPRGSKLRHIVEEMVTTEREYVRSLRYIIEQYFPEMDRPDVPQDLRGKRSVVFGNLEKLLDFHSQFFLKELEACWKHPLRVPHCFLRHQEQFGLYALYSKNKPKSDALLANHGNSFFRRKQVELGDKMDLSSYLLKPIQRMSKYALLLSDLIKEVGVSQSQEAELVTLHSATNMVKFQLRHGNDLLAMDAIRDCDVNLKEQGQLIRQDEFTVWSGRRKCQRHVFLFEDLVLFSKPKRMEGGLDVFIYKHSFKTADVGLTESTGDDGLRFEIWFRRRTSKNQTFILQASSSEVKQAWTSDVARILWNQATRNKEMRLKEMVSMGVGNKPFLDIQPSDAAISDRAVHYIMKSRGARTRASIAVSVFDHSDPFKRSVVTSDPSSASGPSSSSLLGPLNLHMFSQTLSSAAAAEGSFINSCIEEDEQEHETSSQPSMTTESSGSSSRCLSGSTGSDSGCVSSHLQEALQEEPNPSQPSSSSSSSSSNAPPTNKQHLNSQYISANAGPVISPATIV